MIWPIAKQNQRASGERHQPTSEPVALIVYILLLRRPHSQLIADNGGRSEDESMDLGCDLRGSAWRNNIEVCLVL